MLHADENRVPQPNFVKGEGECLELESQSEDYSVVALAEAQYRWAARNYPGYRFREHMTPKPAFLKKLGCETKRGSILRFETNSDSEVTVCFCLPAKKDKTSVSRAAG